MFRSKSVSICIFLNILYLKQLMNKTFFIKQNNYIFYIDFIQQSFKYKIMLVYVLSLLLLYYMYVHIFVALLHEINVIKLNFTKFIKAFFKVSMRSFFLQYVQGSKNNLVKIIRQKHMILAKRNFNSKLFSYRCINISLRENQRERLKKYLLH